MTAIMISGGIDLSVGSTVALVTVGIAMLVRWLQPQLPAGLREAQVLLPAAMMLGILLGGLCGAINGLLISSLRVVPFIVTLGQLQGLSRTGEMVVVEHVGVHARRRQELVVQSDPGDRAAAGLAAGCARGLDPARTQPDPGPDAALHPAGPVRLRDRLERGRRRGSAGSTCL